MRYTYRDSDSSALSTPQSRSARIAPRTRGFTLIELLVVVSIIALLSTIVLAAVADARAKGRNAAKNELVLEYKKALELYRSNNNTYPVTTATPVCFGYADGETCYADLRSGSTALTTSMQNYMGGNFAHRTSVQSSMGDLKGILYTCNGTGSCSAYTLVWILEGTATRCPASATETSVAGNRGCTLIPN